jgi:tRNA (cmo5U34)-methyltransferase
MAAEIWKDREVAKAFLTERSLLIPDRPRQLEVLLRVLRLSCPQARRILDLGAGDGILLAALLEAFPQAGGVAVDFSPLMLEQAGQRLGKFGQRANCLEADLQTPNWKTSLAGPFDVIVSGFAIHHLADERKRALYQEIFDLLSEGGVFLNCEHVASATPRIEQMFDDAMTEHLYLTVRRYFEGSGSKIHPVFQGLHHFPELGLVGGVGVNGSVQEGTPEYLDHVP